MSSDPVEDMLVRRGFNADKINTLYDWIGFRPSMWPADSTGQHKAVQHFVKYYKQILKIATHRGFDQQDLNAIKSAFCPTSTPEEHEAAGNYYGAKYGNPNAHLRGMKVDYSNIILHPDPASGAAGGRLYHVNTNLH